jgi:hypothetical protein
MTPPLPADPTAPRCPHCAGVITLYESATGLSFCSTCGALFGMWVNILAIGPLEEVLVRPPPVQVTYWLPPGVEHAIFKSS